MIQGKVVPVANLSDKQMNDMFAIMQKYYDNIEWNNFYNDLTRKLDTVILCDESDTIKGFTTLALFEYRENIRILFSGDTVVEREYWGANNLPHIWAKNAIEHSENFMGTTYWLLLSKGYKTYRYLHAFFNEFYPRFDAETPKFAIDIIDGFCRQNWGEKYQNGVIKMGKDYLKDGVAAIDEKQMKDKNTAFFVEKNPNYQKGDELVCLAEISLPNLNKLGRKILGR